MNSEHTVKGKLTPQEEIDASSSDSGSGGMEGAKRKNSLNWQSMSGKQRGRIIAQGVIQFALLIWTLWDLRHRSADKIKGSKRFWTLFAFVQPIGPISYLLFGRKR
jgi:hypothetical protein